MKKLISCLLAVLLVCSLMSLNVFADTTDRVVGNGPTPDINDGVNDFTSSNGANADINVNFGQENTKGEDTNGDGIPDTPVSGGEGTTIVHKYAVDITYGEFLLDLTKVNMGGENVPGDANGDDLIEDGETVFVPYYMVWDVNNYKYVLCKKEGETYVPVTPSNTDESGDVNEETGADEPNNVPDALENPFTLDSKVTVTNHSDLSVFTKLVLTNNRNDINWEITAAQNDGEEEAVVSGLTATEEITKATAETTAADGTVTAGSATDGSTYSFTATPAAADGWLGVVGNLLNEDNTVVIGNITVTIAPSAIA